MILSLRNGWNKLSEILAIDLLDQHCPGTRWPVPEFQRQRPVLNMVEKTVYDIGKANQHVRWAFSRPPLHASNVKEMLKQDDVWRDLVQELYFVALWLMETEFIPLKKPGTTPDAGYGFSSRIRLPGVPVDGYPAGYTFFGTAFLWGKGSQWIRTRAGKRLPDGYSHRQPYGRSYYHHSEKTSPNWYRPAYYIREVGNTGKRNTKVSRKLVKEGKVIEVARESWRSTNISPLYFIAGSAIRSSKVKTDIYKLIWHAYFVERKVSTG